MPETEAKVCSTCERVYAREADFLENTEQWKLCSNHNLWFNCSCGSTLMIRAGKFPWYSPADQLTTPQAKGLFNTFRDNAQVPHIPSALMELQQLILSPTVESKDLVAAVRREPWVASEVARCFHGRRSLESSSTYHPLDIDLNHAVAYIGRRELSSIVMVSGLRRFQLQTKIFSSDQFWEESLQVALVAEDLWARQGYGAGADLAYLAGYLLNTGKLVAALVYPERTDAVVRRIADPQTQSSWLAAEKIVGLPDHRVLGEVGAAFWGFHSAVRAAILGHHSPPPFTRYDTYSQLVAIVSLAVGLVHWIRGEPHRFSEGHLEEVAAGLRLGRSDIEQRANDYSAKLKR